MKVLFAASECAPIVKVGGLADVVGGLPKALRKLGVDVSIAIPKYESIQKTMEQWSNLTIDVEYASKTEKVLVYETKLPDTSIPVYLLENPNYLSTGPIYSAKSAEGSPLDIDRFSFFSKAVVEFISSLRGNDKVTPFDIIHCHDWHTSLIPQLVKSSKFKVKTLLTIHNMGKQYQGRRKDTNILLQGIINADLLNTVSATYAQEIQTKEFGEGLDQYLRQYKDKLFGILNGVDYEVWNPQTDKYLTTNYGLVDWQTGKARNKIRLLETVGLPKGEDVPTFGMVSRIAEQKGFDILIPALEKLFSASRVKLVGSDSNQDMRVIILGVGDPEIEDRIKKLEAGFKDKLKFITLFDETLAHLIYAGSDFFLIPSRFEPGGLTQLIAMRYGTLPIVRKVGGLADSVEDKVTGFVFEEYTSEALLAKIEEALKHLGGVRMHSSEVELTESVTYRQMVNSALQKDFSWDKSAKEYLRLYKKLCV